MKKTTMFIANDGEQFATAAEAKAHDAHILACAKADKVLQALHAEEKLNGLDLEVLEIIAEHADTLKKVLVEATVQRRGPRVKAEEAPAA